MLLINLLFVREVQEGQFAGCVESWLARTIGALGGWQPAAGSWQRCYANRTIIGLASSISVAHQI